MFGTFPYPMELPMRRTMLSAILLLSVVACGSDSGNSLTGTNPTGSGPLSATIDGKAWASAVPAAIYRNNIVSIAGIDAALTTTLSFAFAATGPGTFSIAPGNQTGGLGLVVKTGATSQTWGSALTGGSGSVTLTTLTANHVVGTFAFDAVPSGGGATGTVHVTGGKFDITF